MASASVAAVFSPEVRARDEFGRFLAEMKGAATATISQALEEGARFAKAESPKGTKDDDRGPSIQEGITWALTGANTGHLVSLAAHSAPQEYGAAPHRIEGSPDLSFFWEAEGRWFVPASQLNPPDAARVTVINHPGNPSQPFMRPAYKYMTRRIVEIAKERYPG